MSLNVQYRFSAIDEITRIVAKISKATTKLDDKIVKLGKTSVRTAKKMKKAFNGIRKSANSAATKIGGLVTAYLGMSAIKSVVTDGMRFEDSMAGVAAITNASTENLKIFSDESMRMAERFGVSASNVADSFLAIGSAKSELLDSPMELSTIVEQTALLAKAGGVSMDIATDSMTKSLNIFMQGADQAQRFSDVMIAGTVVGAAQLDEFAQSILNTGGAAFRAGLDIEETTALLQLLSKGGEVSSRAGTAMDAFFRVMATDKFKDVDISSGEKILAFMDKLKVMQDNGELNLTADFGAEATRALGIMLSQKKHFKGYLDDIRDSTGSTQTAADIRMNTISERLKRANAKLENNKILLFQRLRPTILGLTKRLNDWLDGITDEDIKNLGANIDILIDAMSGLGKVVSFLWGKFKEFGEWIGETLARFHIFMSDGLEQSGRATGYTKNMAQIDYSDPKNAITKLTPTFDSLSSELPPNFESLLKVDVNVNQDGKVTSTKVTSKGRNIKAKSNLE